MSTNNTMEVDFLPTANNSTAGFGRNGSMDTADSQMNPHANMKVGGVPPPGPMYQRGGYAYPPHRYGSTRHPLPIKAVVTTSFEEREDRMERRDPSAGFSHRAEYGYRHNHSPPHYGSGREDIVPGFEPPRQGREPGQYPERNPAQYGRDLPPIQESDVEERHPPHHMVRGERSSRVPPSPRDESPYIHRSHSGGGPAPPSYRGQGPMKRSFWHHARPGEEHQTLPNEFMPPKRSKTSPDSGRSREYVVTARSTDDPYTSDRHGPSPPSSRSPGWFNRAMSWEASRDDYYQRDPASRVYTGSWSSRSPPYREGGPVPHWSSAPAMPSPRGRYPSEPTYEDSPPGHMWSRWHQPSEEYGWNGHQNRDEYETSMRMGSDPRERSSFEREMYRQGTFESHEMEPPMRYVPGPPRSMEPVHSMMQARPQALMSDMERNSSSIRLLALPEDRISLSETLCLVRENIEVFTATVEDVEAPAPGRKHAVVVGQVGLRCIHCRHCTRSSERVKRAVCYPSSIKRIYRTVIDMKLDHFLHCRFVPDSLKDTLNALKANNTRSTGTTMQYFIRAAGTLGMVDGTSGVRLVDNNNPPTDSIPASLPSETQQTLSPTDSKVVTTSKAAVATPESNSPGDEKTSSAEVSIDRNNSMTSQQSNGSNMMADEESVPKELFTGKVSLALPEDESSLSPLRCFLREQVCAFSATDEDIAVRTPTTFSVSVGQVGIGCVHCLNQPAKLRLNRAVCFPFSIARIYQSVADIQRFHLGECTMVPPDIKQKFLELQSASSKGSKGLATRQYWVTAAKKIGLIDTSKGIHFGRDPSIPEEKAVSLDILAQVASHVTTVNRPLVVPDDKPQIAEFLFVVMAQLQACRFTEADRNKRRLKDVGCIGVECKHCAGKVDSRKFFWSSVSAVESNFVSVHTHMMECVHIPAELKEKLVELKKLRKEQTAALKTGSQKAFFARVWERLHGQEQENAKAAAQAAEKAAAEAKEKAQEIKETPEIKKANSTESMSQDSFLLSPINSPMNSPKKMEESPIPTTLSPASPDSHQKIKNTEENMAVVSA